MIKPAQNYITEIQGKYAEHLYDIAYQWYYTYAGTRIPDIPDNNYNSHWFASVDSNNDVIGIITYSINEAARSCYNFGIMSFSRGNLQFLRDVKQVIDDIFYKYNFNRINFLCFADNPALRGYRHFIKKYGGREVGIYRQCNMLMDGKLHDAVIFEILKNDYIERR